MPKKWDIWIDTGGTFTDCLARDPKDQIHKLKVLSSSRLRCQVVGLQNSTTITIAQDWPITKNILSGYDVKLLASPESVKIHRFDPKTSQIFLKSSLKKIQKHSHLEVCSNEEVPVFACRILTQTALDQSLPSVNLRLGSTRGTNALLERKGARVAFLTTQGFKDLIAIGDQQRPDLFALDIVKSRPYYQISLELTERINSRGEVVLAPDESEIIQIVKILQKDHIESVAVAFLHSYLNPEHEKYVKDKLKAAGFHFISSSAELARSIKILPRAETAVANAYLDPIIKTYLQSIRDSMKSARLQIMTSSGGLIGDRNFKPKDSLLSGPAGGLVGATIIGKKVGARKILTLDMGGTSTDVSRYDNAFDYQFETKVGHARIVSPALAIETIAAGGGSICHFDGYKFNVGPESAGAEPGPACYGLGGPLTITDINLLLGRIDIENFGIPLNPKMSEIALNAVIQSIEKKYGHRYSREKVLLSFLRIANEKMAGAIRKISTSKGFDPKEYTLLAFGGAGGQHACQIADLLQVDSIIIPRDAGLLSAFGIGHTSVERFISKQVLKPWEKVSATIDGIIYELEEAVISRLLEDGFQKEQVHIRDRLFYMRMQGQDHLLEIPGGDDVIERFQKEYIKLFGHWIKGREIELESIKVIACNITKPEREISKPETSYHPETKRALKSLTGEAWNHIPIYDLNDLTTGASITGPVLLAQNTSTTFIDAGWEVQIDGEGNTQISRSKVNSTLNHVVTENPEEASMELFINRFTSVAENMGALYQRTSFSVNIKERLDFSCGIVDAEGYLVVNAPHIPVHLGGLGICVRSVTEKIKMYEGDVIITNHPSFGGSHLPDITLISPVYYDDTLIAYVVNRGHHAEIGGSRPGSMPPDAKSLEEEGVIIYPTYLVEKGITNWDAIRGLFDAARYPSRLIEENMADLNGALASIIKGRDELQILVEKFGIEQVMGFMGKIRNYASESLHDALAPFKNSLFTAEETLDNGALISVSVDTRGKKVIIDFAGTSPQQSNNMNATPAVTMSAVLYVLRLLSTKRIPLNEGFLKSVEVKIPPSLLNPDFSGPAETCPPVVGGNTETSQRLVDTLLKAFGVAACSQGTMNNLLFGNDELGYYETICGGVGAVENVDGADAVHQHMTNTRITDPEILEHRYPVTLGKFEIRRSSGGLGKWKGGDGVIRKITFNAPMEVTVLTQHRKVAPYGMAGGEDGKVGEQWIETKDGVRINLKWKDQYNALGGDCIVICTPGGGGYGSAKETNP